MKYKYILNNTEHEVDVLLLPIKRQWFDMIFSELKDEEYRNDIFWKKRILNARKKGITHILFRNGYNPHNDEILIEWKGTINKKAKARNGP